MSSRKIIFIVIPMACLLMMCSKNEEIVAKPGLYITLKDDSSKIVTGAMVRLYKNATDTGITKVSDSGGVVIFYDLEPILYYWLAVKGCSTNRNSQVTLNRALIPGAIMYGYSVLTQTGTLKITNTSIDRFRVSDSSFSIILPKDSPVILYPKIGAHTIRSENLVTPGILRDTTIQIRCGDTSFLVLPY